VLSNNELQPDDLAPLRALRGSLRQLTLMGSRMAHLPHVLSTLTALRVLYLDGVAGSGQGQAHEHICEVLGPLSTLGVLSLGSSRLEHFPPTLGTLTSLRALYLDNNASLASLPAGPYLSKLRVLGLDWRVLFASHAVLHGAPRLHKLCLTSIGSVEQGEQGSSPAALTPTTDGLPTPAQRSCPSPSLALHPSQELTPRLMPTKFPPPWCRCPPCACCFSPWWTATGYPCAWRR
jgi:hypothetical protein